MVAKNIEGRQKAFDAIEKLIAQDEPIRFIDISKKIGVPSTTIKRVYDENFKGKGVIGRARNSNKIIDDQNKKSLKDLSTKKYLEKIYKIDNYQSLVAFHVNSLKAQKNQSIMNDGKVIDSEDYRLKDTSIFRGIDKFKNNLRKKCPPKFYQFLKNIYPYFKFLIFKYKNLKNRKFF